MKNQKRVSTLVGIVIIVIVAIIAFGGVFAYQYFSEKTNNQPQVQNQQQTTTTDQTAGWKTYTTNEYGFELKYPANWQIDSPLSIKNPKTGSYFFVSQLLAGTPINVGETQPIYINGVKAYKLYTRLNSPNLFFQVVNLVNTKNQEFLIEAYSGLADDNKILEQMLSTFKFTK